MGIPATLVPLAISLPGQAAERPADDDVVAGWTAFALFLLLALAVALLGWSFTRQMKKVRRAREEGVYGEDDIPRDEPDGAGEPAESGDDPDAVADDRDRGGSNPPAG